MYKCHVCDEYRLRTPFDTPSVPLVHCGVGSTNSEGDSEKKLRDLTETHRTGKIRADIASNIRKTGTVLMQVEPELEYIYDAFVSYNHQDTEWVDTYITTLELQHNFHFCIEAEEWRPGPVELWQIEGDIRRTVEKSRRMILILSYSYAASTWCQIELNVIQSDAIQKRT